MIQSILESIFLIIIERKKLEWNNERRGEFDFEKILLKEFNLPVQPCNTNKPKRFAKESWRNNFYAPTVDEPLLLFRSRQQHRTRYLDENNVT